MSDIIVPDRPSFVDDEEVLIGRHVRAMTWQKMSEAINWLNMYAKKVLPYHRIGVTSIGSSTPPQMIYPVDLEPQTTRYITVVAGLRAYTGSGNGDVTVTTSTDTTGVAMKNFAQGGSGGTGALGSEESVTYGVAHVQITGNRRELIKLTPDTDLIIDGWGAWELPEGMYSAEGSGGLVKGRCVVHSSATYTIDPMAHWPNAHIDTDIDDVQTGLVGAYDAHRPILFCAGVAGNSGPMRWHTDSPNNTGSYVSLPTGGIYIPPLAYKTGATQKAIKVAVAAHNGAAGNSSWRVETSIGNYDGAAITTTASRWLGSSSFSSPFDPTQDGEIAYVDPAGEWVQIGLREDSGTTANPQITAICIWDAG